MPGDRKKNVWEILVGLRIRQSLLMPTLIFSGLITVADTDTDADCNVKAEISLSGFWSERSLENRGFLVFFLFFLLVFPRKMARKNP